MPEAHGWEYAVMNLATVPVVASIGQSVTKDELGGTQIHGRNGTVDDVVESEAEAFARTRRCGLPGKQVLKCAHENI